MSETPPPVFDWKPPPPSKWKAYLIGDPSQPKNCVIFHPAEGGEPNWFHRYMQRLAFGVKWVKE